MMTEMCKEMLDLKRKNKIKLKECFPLLKQQSQAASSTTTTNTTTSLLTSSNTSTAASSIINTSGTNGMNTSSSSSSGTVGSTTNVNGTAAGTEGAVVATPAPIDVDDLNFFSNEAWFSDIFLGRA